MAKYKSDEDYFDMGRQVYDQYMTFAQVATCLLLNIPCALDFNWWGHSVCGLDLVEYSPSKFGILIWNSWGDAWGDRGEGLLRDGKEIPNGAVGVRTMRVVA